MNVRTFQQEIILENEMARLIPFESSRRHELSEIIFDEDIWTFMGVEMKTQRDFTTYLEDTLLERQSEDSYPFLIIDQKSNRVAGSTRYGHLNVAKAKCEIGWTWLGRAFQGTGLNKACKYALLKFGFESIGFRRIQFSTDQENIRSQRAILRLGAIKEGLFRNNYIDASGKSRNDIYFSIIKEDWPTIKLERFSEFNGE